LPRRVAFSPAEPNSSCIHAACTHAPRLTRHERIVHSRPVLSHPHRTARPQGLSTTLKRDGSDYSASILGKLLKAQSITIWTDVR
jgi:hypothetical protein